MKEEIKKALEQQLQLLLESSKNANYIELCSLVNAVIAISSELRQWDLTNSSHEL